MEKRFLMMVMLAVLLVAPVLADDYTPEQKAFRTNIMTFLKEEGFAPYLDENSLTFKKEGQIYWINISDGSPFYIEFHRSGLGCGEADKSVVLLACNHVNNTYKCAKVALKDDVVSIAVELYCHSAEEFRYTFYKDIQALDAAREALLESYDELLGQSSAPFSISSVEVANTDISGNIVNGYGTKINSYQTKYLKPRITCDVQTAGSYDIYVKFYKADGTLSTGDSSPSGYSYKCTVNMDAGTHTYMLDGWGGKTAGFWNAGTYRFEFYYDDTQIGKTHVVVN